MKTWSSPGVLFAFLCLFWGSNWLVLKLAVADVPPFAFAGARAVLAGTLMIALAGPREALALLRAQPGRVLATAALTNTIAYAAMYWGTARISTGVAAIVNNALMPVGLFAFGLMLGEERFALRRLAGIVLGGAGLVLLFAGRGGDAILDAGAAGIAAMAGGTLAWCLGSVASRGLLRAFPPMTVGGLQMLVGGAAILPLAAAFEGPVPSLVAAFARPVPLLGVVWMAVFGGVFGLTIYLRLLRDWGPTRAGMYAFVSPLVATVLGALVLSERLGPVEAAGGAVMLAAAALVLPPPGTGARPAPADATTR